MRPLAAAFLACTLLVAAGCGSHADPRRDAVNAYFRQVNDVQRQMVSAISRVNIAYRKFSTKGGLAQEQGQLAAAEQTIRALRARLARLRPPPLAVPIHRDLIRLFDADAGVARELAGMAAFLPAFDKARAPLAAVDRRMRLGLAKSRRPAAQATVLEEYAAGCAAALVRLARLRPPAVLEPTHRSEVALLTSSRSVSLQLARALRRHDAIRLPGLSARFQAIAGGADVLTGANEEALAIAAYARRVQAIGRLEARIARERERLQARLG